MLKIGCIILTTWAILNLIPSSIIVIHTIFRGGHTPALYSILDEQEVGALSTETLASVDSIAVFANGTNIALCLLSLFVIWMGLYRRQTWAFWGLLVSFTFALLAGVGGDYEVGYQAPIVNVISGGILALGFAISAAGIFRS